nr:DNA-directed DNA polymerase [Tanacetum cinerariifolium]
MAKMFLGKYFPHSMVTKLRNEITNFGQRPDESLFEAWEHYKLSIDRSPNHNMLPVTQIDTFYNGLTLRHRDTINAAAGGTFMKSRPEECYDLIKNMIAHRNDWDTSVQQSESSSSITSSSDLEIVALKAKIAEINKNLMKVLQINQQVKAVTHNCKTCGGPHSYNDCPATVGQTQHAYAAGAYNQCGTLPSNTITNPKEDLKGITTRSGTTYKGPTIPTTSYSPPRVVEHEVEVTKDTPSRLHDQKLCDKANDQKEKFFKIFQDLDFNISFADALIHMLKFGPTIKSLLTNKEKLFELARTLLNKHCSAVLLKKLPEKLGDPGKFLIPCDLPGTDECLALADLGASINLVPLSVWNKLSLPERSPTCMTPELADCSISRPVGVAEDVFVKILSKDRLRVGKEAVTFNLDQTSRYSANYDVMSVNRIDLINVACEEYSQEVLRFSMSGNPTPSTEPIVSNSSPAFTPFGDSDFLLEETDAFLAIDDEPISPKIKDSYYDSEGDILLLEEFLNDDPSSPPLPPQELKGDDKLPVIIAKDLKDDEKTALIKVLKSHKQALAWQLSDIKGIDPEFRTHKILMEDDFKPAVQHQRRISLVHCVPKKGGFTVVENEENELIPIRLVTGWRVCIDYQKLNDATRKDHFSLPFMDQMLERLARNEYYCFLDGFSGTFQRCMMAIFHDMIKKTMEVFMADFSVFGNSFKTCLFHLDKMLKRCEDTSLCLNWEKSHFMVKEGIILGHKISKNGTEIYKAKVDVIAKLPHPTTIKGAENLAADHLSQLENPHQSVLDKKEINETFLLETLNMVSFPGDLSTPWTTPSCSKSMRIKSFDGVFTARKPLISSRLATMDPPGEIMARTTPPKRCLTQIFISPQSIVMPTTWSNLVTLVNVRKRFRNGMKCLKIPSKFARFLTFGASISGAVPVYTREQVYILMAVDYLSKWVEAKALLTDDARVVCKNLKSLFASDYGTYFCNDQFAKVMLKYGVTHRLSTAYHPQTSRQVEVFNRGLKRILERTVGEDRASWSDKLDDALWAFRKAFKTPIECTPYKLVYEKACHLPIELEHKAYWP